jgi:hypothetical protein
MHAAADAPVLAARLWLWLHVRGSDARVVVCSAQLCAAARASKCAMINARRPLQRGALFVFVSFRASPPFLASAPRRHFNLPHSARTRDHAAPRRARRGADSDPATQRPPKLRCPALRARAALRGPPLAM